MDELEDQPPAEKKCRTHSALAGTPAVSLPPRVLQAVAASQFLTTPELGRLLLRTSKELTASTYSRHDDVWKCLCMTHSGVKNASALLGTMAPLHSAEQCFRTFFTDLPPKYTEPRALRYTPEDYAVVVTIRESDTNQQLVCKVIPGQEIAEFFDTGALEIGFDPFPWKRTVEGTEYDDSGFPETDSDSIADLSLHSTVRIVRRSDLKTVQVLDEKTGKYVLDSLVKSGERKGVFLLHPECAHENTNRDGSCCHMNATYAKFLFSYHHIELSGIERFCRIEFDLEPIFRLESYKSDDGFTGQATIALSGCTISSDFTDYDLYDRSEISKVLKGKDVTFAHFLEALDVWFTP